jgi:hypothetical protein
MLPLQPGDEPNSKVDADLEHGEALCNLSGRFLLQLDALVETANRIMLITMRSNVRAHEELNAFVTPRIVTGEHEKNLHSSQRQPIITNTNGYKKRRANRLRQCVWYLEVFS